MAYAPIPQNNVRSIGKIEQHEHCDVADAKRVNLVSPDGLKKVDVITDGSGVDRLAVDAAVSVTAAASAKPDINEIFNINVTAANTEFSQVLPATTEIYTITVRTNKVITLQYTFVSGETNTKFITVRQGTTRRTKDIAFDTAKTIYFELNKIETGGTIVEIETWRNV